MIMRNSFHTLVVLCCLMIGALDAAPASGQSAAPPPAVVGVVDYDLVMNESKAGKSARTQLEKQLAAYKAEFKKQRKAFDDANAKLGAQQSSLSQEDLKKKIDELNAQGAKAEKALAQQEKALDANYENARKQIGAALGKVVAEIAKKRGLTLVLKRSDVLVFAKEYDLTDEAMKQLDAKMPSIKLQASN
jgi:outer membrane protein